MSAPFSPEAAGTRGSGQLFWLRLLGPASHCSWHQQCCRQHNRYISQQLLFLKQPGRVGQASCFGCGCWAQRPIAVGTSSVAVSTTGKFHNSSYLWSSRDAWVRPAALAAAVGPSAPLQSAPAALRSAQQVHFTTAVISEGVLEIRYR